LGAKFSAAKTNNRRLRHSTSSEAEYGPNQEGEEDRGENDFSSDDRSSSRNAETERAGDQGNDKKGDRHMTCSLTLRLFDVTNRLTLSLVPKAPST